MEDGVGFVRCMVDDGFGISLCVDTGEGVSSRSSVRSREDIRSSHERRLMGTPWEHGQSVRSASTTSNR